MVGIVGGSDGARINIASKLTETGEK